MSGARKALRSSASTWFELSSGRPGPEHPMPARVPRWGLPPMAMGPITTAQA